MDQPTGNPRFLRVPVILFISSSRPSPPNAGLVPRAIRHDVAACIHQDVPPPAHVWIVWCVRPRKGQGELSWLAVGVARVADVRESCFHDL